MKARGGYLVLENIVSVITTSIILITLYGLLFSTLNIYQKIHSSIEIQQQGTEIQYYIEKELKNNIEIANIKTIDNKNMDLEDLENEDIVSIKYKPIDRLDNLGFDEIFFNKKSNKIFIKRNNSATGYEIGNYLDHIYISKTTGGKGMNIKLELSKNKQKQDIKFSI